MIEAHFLWAKAKRNRQRGGAVQRVSLGGYSYMSKDSRSQIICSNESARKVDMLLRKLSETQSEMFDEKREGAMRLHFAQAGEY
jgi:hypothetical protein